MRRERSYNIHNVLTFSILDQTGLFGRLVSEIGNEYSYFECEKIDDPDLIVRLGKFVPSVKDSYILDDEFYVKENGFYGKDAYKLDRWKLEVGGLEESRLTARISSNFFGNIHISRFTNFLIYLKMMEKGYPMIHASCVGDGSHAYIFATTSGGGKTTIASYLVERGFKFMGDNYVILHDGDALSFPSPLRIFTYNLTPIIRRCLGAKDRVLLGLKQLVYGVTSGYAKIFLRLDANKLFADMIVDESKIDSVFLILPKRRFRIDEISKGDLIDRLVINQKLEFHQFSKFMLSYSYVFPNSRMANYQNSLVTKEKEHLERALRGDIKIFSVEVPPTYNAETLEAIFGMLE